MTELLTKQQIIDMVNYLDKNFDPNNIDHIKQLLYLTILNQALPEENNITDFISNLLSRCDTPSNMCCTQKIIDPIEPWDRKEITLQTEFFSPILQFLYG